ncbi:MAG: Ldh family oxidoreductase [Gemmatimonadaceae bacterium]
MTVDVRHSIASPSLGVMTFLNEVVQRFPHAISFAPGRPSDRFLNVEDAVGRLERWADYRARVSGQSPRAVMSSLGQYGNTAGIIQELLSRHLAVDLSIHADEASIVVTTGCQEAMLIAALTLLEPSRDTLLVSDPSYIGMTGVAELAGVPVHPVPTGADGLRAETVVEAIHEVRRSGRRPRALYDVPDFNNPLGTCMPVEARRELLAVAGPHDLLILEDNPYGAFAYDHLSLPTLKALDTARSVVYLGSFAKTLFPGLRIGYMVADQEIADGGGPLSRAFTTVKSLTTVNTSPITQAMVGAALLEHDGSLASVVEARLPHYRRNRDGMLAALARAFAGDQARGVSWNHPTGGFFLVITLPFEFGSEQLERCARDFGVIVSPMRYFALSPGRERQVRLAFSYVDATAIDEGIHRFAAFVNDEIEQLRWRTVVAPSAAAPTADAPAHESLDALLGLVERGLLRRGVSGDDASFIASSLVATSGRGVDTHGLRLLPTYLRELEGGRARVQPIVRWTFTTPAVRAMDADGALGIVAGRVAVAEVIDLARRNGVGAISVSNSNHFGAAAIYSTAIARAGLIGIACSNSDALVAPFGGLRPALGTNPLSMAAIADNGEVFCADFATSQVTYSQVKAYRERGWRVPDEWVVSSTAANNGHAALKPLGGYKGQCLGMMVEILSSLLSGGAFGHELSHFYTEPFIEPRGVSHFFLAVDPAAFGDAVAFRARVGDFLAFMRAEPGIAGDRVRAPGDPQSATFAERSRDGIPLWHPELACIRSLQQEERAMAVSPVSPVSTRPQERGQPVK